MIYFIQCDGDGPIKIGKSSNPYKRRNLFQIGCPYFLEIRAIYNGSITEDDFHERFKEYNIHGEWFEPDEHIISFMKENCDYYKEQVLYEEAIIVDAGRDINIMIPVGSSL